jgi:hypothetical protein
MWLIAFWGAVVVVVPVVLLENQAPWVVGLSVFVGILLGIIFEVNDDLREKARVQKFALLRAKQELNAQSDFGVTRCFVDSNLLGSAAYLAVLKATQPQKNTNFTVDPSNKQPRENSKIRSQASEAHADYGRLILAASP